MSFFQRIERMTDSEVNVFFAKRIFTLCHQRSNLTKINSDDRIK